MKLEPGFNIKLIASEPLIHTPIAMTFDKYGRIWALEMEDYMPDTLGTGENIPSAKVVILTDKNKDGVMDEGVKGGDRLIDNAEGFVFD